MLSQFGFSSYPDALYLLMAFAVSRARAAELQNELDEKETLQLAKDDALELTQNKLHQAETTVQKLRQQQAKVNIQMQDVRTRHQTGTSL